MFLLNSRLGLFTAAPSGCYTLPGRPFSRSYGVILPSSLTRVLPRAFACSARLPVSVCGTGAFAWLEAFLGSGSTRPSGTSISPPHHSPAFTVHGFACAPASLLGQTLPSVCDAALLRHPIARSGLRRYRNFNLLSFDYAFRPRLRSRLTLSGRTFLRNP